MDEPTTSARIRAEAVQGPQRGPAWTFAVPAGGVLWIPDEEDSGMCWLDWLTGIEPPPAGRVLWKDVEWRDRDPDDAAAERGRMGCTFASGGLVVNLDMDENVWLPARMHHRAEAAEAIERWARFFGCWPLPSERASLLRERDRRRILWTRAFSGDPEALVLEQPLQGASADDRALLLSAVKQVRAAGGAVVWVAESMDAETQAALEPVLRAAPENG